jgi:hypothetical protein
LNPTQVVTDDSPFDPAVTPPAKTNGRAHTAQPGAQQSANSAITGKKKGRRDRKAYSAAQAECNLQEGGAKQSSFPIRKPGSTNYFMVATDLESRMDQVFLLDGGMDGFFLINGDLVASNPIVRRAVKRYAMATCVNHQQRYFIWPVALGNPKTATSSFKAIAAAERRWVRLEWNSFAQGYDIEPVDSRLYPELANTIPVFSPSAPEIMDEAFNDNSIDEITDPRLTKLLQGLQ